MTTELRFVPDGFWTDAYLGEIVVAAIETDEGEGFRARSYLPYRGPELFATLDEAKAWVVCDACLGPLDARGVPNIDIAQRLRFACKGYPAEGRVPIGELRGTFDHQAEFHEGDL